MLIERLSLSSPISTDKHGLALLISSCVKLGNETSLPVDILWPGEHHKLSSLLNDRILFSNSRMQLMKLKAASRLMARLQFALTVKIEALERTILPASKHFGLEDLPDEIIMQILRLCYNDYDETETDQLRQTALLNRRFRDLVYGMPSLWSDICTESKQQQWWEMKKVQRALRRLPDIPLDIDLSRDSDEHVLNHVQSWHSIHISDSSTFAYDPPAIRIPLLEEISTFSDFPDDGCPPILRACELPRLRKLLSTRIYDAPANVMTRLTSLDLISLQFSEARQINDFCKLIRTGRELRFLELHASFFDYQGFQGLSWPPTRGHLPNLETFVFSIDFHYSFGPSEFTPEARVRFLRGVASIPHVLDMPNVVTLELDYDDEYDLRELSLDDIFPRNYTAHTPYPKLRYLRFETQARAQKEREAINGAFVPRLLQHFPHVERFELCHASFNLGTATGKVAKKGAIKNFNELAILFARLRELRLRYTDMGIKDLEKLMVAMLQQRVIGLERIGIDFEISSKRHNCAPMDPGFWTHLLRQRLKRDFLVEFSGGVSLDVTYSV